MPPGHGAGHTRSEYFPTFAVITSGIKKAIKEYRGGKRERMPKCIAGPRRKKLACTLAIAEAKPRGKKGR